MSAAPDPDASEAGVDAAPAAARPWWVEHRPFLVAVGIAAALRVVAHLAFTPALVHSDGPMYLSVYDDLTPYYQRPVGYVLYLLLPVLSVVDDVMAVVAVQHVIGLATAVVLYLLLRRWGVGRWVATLGTLPVLFDSLQLVLEHTVLSDTLFVFLAVCGLAALSWRRRPSWPLALAAGVLLGMSATVRQVGEPLLVAAAVYCLLVLPTWRRRLAAAAVVAVGFAVPVGAYASWYHHVHGSYALSGFGGASLYLRTTTFVDCDQLDIPDYQRVLCPAEPVGERRDPTWYVFHDETTVPMLRPPAGTTPDQAMREFAMTAIRTQPGDYARTVVRDFFLNFWPVRVDKYEYDTAYKWGWRDWIGYEPTSWTGPAFAAHGGDLLAAHQPFADALVQYQRVGYLPGPALFGCLVLGVAGAVGVGRARRSGLRAVTFLFTVSGAGLILVPDVTAEFVWRYQLPAVALLPAAAALGWTALTWRGGPPQRGLESARAPETSVDSRS